MILRRTPQARRRGIALIMVLMIVIVFAATAGLLAISMKVETTLARNSTWDTETEWLGRSGIELAKYFLSQTPPGGGQYDALNQRWAGGVGETNATLEMLSLTDNVLGHGRFSVKIKDADSKFNINLVMVAPEIVDQGLILMGVDAAEAPHIRNAIVDWIDRDDDPLVGSTDTETSFYMTLQPPYKAKNGPLDDLTELLHVKGITPAMFYGSGANAASNTRGVPASNRFNQRFQEEPAYPIGFADLFTTISSGWININTASAEVLQLVPDLDAGVANAIITARNGPDGVQGNEDDEPFKSVGELARVPELQSLMSQAFRPPPTGRPGAGGGGPMEILSRYFSTRSSTFEVEVETEIDSVKRTYYALLRRTGQGNQIVTCYMYWR